MYFGVKSWFLKYKSGLLHGYRIKMYKYVWFNKEEYHYLYEIYSKKSEWRLEMSIGCKTAHNYETVCFTIKPLVSLLRVARNTRNLWKVTDLLPELETSL